MDTPRETERTPQFSIFSPHKTFSLHDEHNVLSTFPLVIPRTWLLEHCRLYKDITLHGHNALALKRGLVTFLLVNFLILPQTQHTDVVK